MKVFPGAQQNLTPTAILAMGTGLSEEEVIQIQILRAHLLIEIREKEFWRELAITAHQKLEAISANGK